MKKFSFLYFLIFSLFSLITIPKITWAGWVFEGGSLNQTESSNASLTNWDFYNEAPLIAFHEGGNDYLQTYNGSPNAWSLLGGSAVGVSYIYDLTVMNNGLYMSLQDYNTTSGIDNAYVDFWDGSTWATLGDSLNINPDYYNRGIVLVNDGSTLYAGLNEDNGPLGFSPLDDPIVDCYVKQWDGTDWIQMGDSLSVDPTYHCSIYSMAVSASGTVYAVITGLDGDSVRAFVKYWDGAQWQELGSYFSESNSGQPTSPSIAFPEGSDTPYVTWSQSNTSYIEQVHIKYWDGTDWVQLGDNINLNTARSADAPSLAFDGETLYVTWLEYTTSGVQVYVKYWDGGTWQQLGNSLNYDLNRSAISTGIFINNSEVHVVLSQNALNSTGRVRTRIYEEVWQVVCGDNYLQGTEECDNGNTTNGDGCSSACAIEICGDGSVNNSGSEQCDDGNTTNGDGCTSSCRTETCGDSIVNNAGAETCDDGNAVNGDGCNSSCRIEVCGDGNVNNSGSEQCDDGNTTNGDGCTSSCQTETCGDGVVNNSGSEQCDDHNTTAGDGCNASCRTEYCGDGIINNSGSETCDDHNITVGDGCSATCHTEHAPVANAGVDFSVTMPHGNSTVNVTINGSASSDSDGDALTYSWTVVSVPRRSVITTARLSTPTAATSSFSADQKGDYTLRLTVRDTSGMSASDTVLVTVR